MLRLNTEQSRTLWQAVRQADRPEIHAEVAGLYHDFDKELERRRPICRASGRCCRFAEYGHRLFVTTIELSTFARRAGEFVRIPPEPPVAARSPLPVLPAREAATDRCPFQRQNLCQLHAIRPLGCRVFFCDESSFDWQRAQYQRFHDRLRRLHDSLNVPYFYVDWLAGLRAVGW